VNLVGGVRLIFEKADDLRLTLLQLELIGERRRGVRNLTGTVPAFLDGGRGCVLAPTRGTRTIFVIVIILTMAAASRSIIVLFIVIPGTTTS
jgi:hypothetical protein